MTSVKINILKCIRKKIVVKKVRVYSKLYTDSDNNGIWSCLFATWHKIFAEMACLGK